MTSDPIHSCNRSAKKSKRMTDVGWATEFCHLLVSLVCMKSGVESATALVGQPDGGRVSFSFSLPGTRMGFWYETGECFKKMGRNKDLFSELNKG